MKKLNPCIIACLAAGLFIHNTSFAQTSVSNASKLYAAGKEKNYTADDNSAGYKMENVKVQRAFIKKFGNTAEQDWSYIDGTFINHFHIEGSTANAAFNKDGSLIYTIMYGTEEQLPAAWKKYIKKQYAGLNVTMAAAIEESGRHIWVVQLENPKEVIKVRIENADIEQVQQFYKSQ